MSKRDELAELVTRTADSDGLYVGHLTAERIADVMLASGYRKPRTVESVEELDTLPAGSILLASDRYPRYKWTLWRVQTGGMIEQVGHELKGVTPFRYFVDPLPVTVLYTPESTP